jgi:hypothetical protein
MSSFLLDKFKINLESTAKKGSIFSPESNPTNYTEKMRGALDTNLLAAAAGIKTAQTMISPGVYYGENQQNLIVPGALSVTIPPTFYIIDSLGRILTTENGFNMTTK